MEINAKNLTVDVYFRGLAGRIEGKYFNHPKRGSPAVLILPPDPRYGGDLNNVIVRKIEEVFIKCEFTVLRINYRGVKHSDGTFNCKEDAIYDASVALDWLQEQNPDASHFWIAGYSFGAWVATNVMMRRPEIETFVLLSPLANKYNYTFLYPCLCPGLIIAGNQDNFTPLEDVEKMVYHMNESALNITTLSVIDGADHLYKDRREQMAQELENYINIKLATRIAQPVRKKRRKRKRKDSII